MPANSTATGLGSIVCFFVQENRCRIEVFVEQNHCGTVRAAGWAVSTTHPPVL